MNIKDVSQKLGISASAIRYYEQEGLLPHITRDKNGIRIFDEHMIRRIQFIQKMRAAGMQITILKRFIHLFDAEEDSQKEQLAILQEQLSIMENKRDDLQSAIDHLRFKIEHFYDHTLKAEVELKALEKKKDK